jgi:putative component of membrane protein insertase Oxa1/YidC/SpoIIIJ protein YidD
VLSKKFVYLVCLTFLLFLFSKANAQNIEEVINFGDSLFRVHKYTFALNEYQRAFYFSKIDHKALISNKIADCYLLVNDLKMARAYYDSTSYYSKNDSIQIECAFRKIICYIKEKNYGYALIKLDELEIDSNEYFKYKKDLYMGISFFGLENYDQAFYFFYKTIDPNDITKINLLDKLYNDREKLMLPNPTVTTFMSAIIPGTGQIYAGELYDGINSILLLSGLFYIGFNAPYINFFILMPFIYRYYMGGIRNANRHAKERKSEKQYYSYYDLIKIFQDTVYIKTFFNYYPEIHTYNEHVKNSKSDVNMFLAFSFLFYKEYISSQDIDACVFYPSCSVYTMQSIEKKGAVIGLLEGFDRLLRCHSFVGKYDYPYNLTTKKYFDDL